MKPQAKPVEQEKENHLQKLVGLLFLLASGVLSGAVIYTANSQKKTVKEFLFEDKYEQMEQRTNSHLQNTNAKVQMDKLRAKLEAGQFANDLNGAVEGVSKAPRPDMDSGAESSESSFAPPTSPSEVIRKEMYEKEQELASQETYKEQYAAQLIENARKQGYQITLTPDYKVKSITPIKKDNSPSLFEDFGGTTAR